MPIFLEASTSNDTSDKSDDNRRGVERTLQLKVSEIAIYSEDLIKIDL